MLNSLCEYEPRSAHHEVPVIWDRAEGCYVWDDKGKRYIDFTSGIFVANVGHNHPHVVEAIKKQVEKTLHTYAFPNEPRARLVEKLCLMTGFEKVYLCSTGAEAVESAIRCMKIYSKHTRNAIDGLFYAFHGKTQGCRDIVKYLRYEIKTLKPFLPSGLIIETFYGYNAEFHDKEWIQTLCSEATQYDIPVCFDEMQSGFGRTGKFFGYEHYGVKPDLVCIGKAFGGGLPISGVLGSSKLLDAPDDLSSTHTGNPVCCAAALAVLEVIESEGLIEKAQQFEPIITSVDWGYTLRGKGAIWALDLQDVDLANKVVDKCAAKGLLLVKTNRGTIKIGAPLVTPLDTFVDGLNILKEVLCAFATRG